jgi:hypothetical protein
MLAFRRRFLFWKLIEKKSFIIFKITNFCTQKKKRWRRSQDGPDPDRVVFLDPFPSTCANSFFWTKSEKSFANISHFVYTYYVCVLNFEKNLSIQIPFKCYGNSGGKFFCEACLFQNLAKIVTTKPFKSVLNWKACFLPRRIFLMVNKCFSVLKKTIFCFLVQ